MILQWGGNTTGCGQNHTPRRVVLSRRCGVLTGMAADTRNSPNPKVNTHTVGGSVSIYPVFTAKAPEPRGTSSEGWFTSNHDNNTERWHR